ncbi:hypothetical protein AB6A40_002596 [Gnathostoma spinigerum]|uniref:Fatty-acid and retinol-binding protein 1 n=1 Tax=Gnathostoma spinigerum TaxID=75299 RepID=A0ABD6EGT0_9BILA
MRGHLHHDRVPLLVFLFVIKICGSSKLSVDIGSGAASQILREVTYQILDSPRTLWIDVENQDEPLLASLLHISTATRISYANLSVKFYPEILRLKLSGLNIATDSNLVTDSWPITLGSEMINLSVHVDDVELATRITQKSNSVLSCNLKGISLSASAQNNWIVDRFLSTISYPLKSQLQNLICPIVSEHIALLKHDAIKNISLRKIAPSQLKDVINARNSSLFYRINSISLAEKHVSFETQLEWSMNGLSDVSDQHMADNETDVDFQWDNDDRLVAWIEDSTINELLRQIEWDFQWMEERIPVSSPVIPQSSREFLSTLCTSCYFLLNVWARGPPTVLATNNSIVLEKRDRLNLRVVNPDRNVTSVFVSMILTINAQLQPTVDSGTLRTLVQLLDTSIVMESGAFPPSWSFFVQDLIRGMILDMMWPELRKQIEELTYSEGIRLAASCGINPKGIDILIAEGRIGLSALLALQQLQARQCVRDMKTALPNVSKIFNNETDEATR